MAHRPSQPIETPDDKSISAMQYLVARLQPRSIFPRSREFVEEQMFLGHAMRKQGIHLQVQLLVVRTDPCIPYQAAILSADLAKRAPPRCIDTATASTIRSTLQLCIPTINSPFTESALASIMDSFSDVSRNRYDLMTQTTEYGRICFHSMLSGGLPCQNAWIRRR